MTLYIQDRGQITFHNITKVKPPSGTVPLKFLITNFFEAPLLLEATLELLAIPLVLCSVMAAAEKPALLSCRVSSAILSDQISAVA